MYLYAKEHDLLSWHFNAETNNTKLCDDCLAKQDKAEQAECKQKHCGTNTN